MINMEIDKTYKEYRRWLEHLKENSAKGSFDFEENAEKELLTELLQIEEAEQKGLKEETKEDIYTRFEKNIEFGTGGIRGIMGAGTNMMNIYTVARVTAGIADYIHSGEAVKDSPLKIVGADNGKKPSVAIAFDSRINSQTFAQSAARILSNRGIDVYLYKMLMPTPALSYTVRKYGCTMGIMITASHNPQKYNGYKVYDNSGSQVTLKTADKILKCVNQKDALSCGKERIEGAKGEIIMLGEADLDAYVDRVMEESFLLSRNDSFEVMSGIKVVYTPLNGAGNVPVRKTLKRAGVENIVLVEEQEMPDGRFPTCTYPNPEKTVALELGIKKAREEDADLLIGTDPDSDRIGVVIKVREDQKKYERLGGYYHLSGNEVGILMFDYLLRNKLERLKTQGVNVPKPLLITTIVSTKMVEAMAEKYGVEVIKTLTGFKFIGEQIAYLENENREHDYIFGFEESIGYLTGTYVRDKDAVSAALIMCEMTALYKHEGKNLIDRLEELYEEIGEYRTGLLDFGFTEADGQEHIKKIMEHFRSLKFLESRSMEVDKVIDYQEEPFVNKNGVEIPKSNVVEFVLKNGEDFIVRPSGTEPKLKIYTCVCKDSREEADKRLIEFEKELNEIVGEVR